jgi:hypothetical protein
MIIVSLSENTQNDHLTKGDTLQVQVEISKKRTNFGVFAAANATPEMCINQNAAARKRTTCIVDNRLNKKGQ